MLYTYEGKTVRIVRDQVWELKSHLGNRRIFKIVSISRPSGRCLDRRVHATLIGTMSRKTPSVCFLRTLVTRGRLLEDAPDSKEKPFHIPDIDYPNRGGLQRARPELHLPRGFSSKDLRRELEARLQRMTLIEACAEIGVTEDVAKAVLNGATGFGRVKAA